MFKKFFRGIFTIIGGLLGYEIYEICSYLLVTMNPNAEQIGLTGTEEAWAISFCVIIFGIIFFPNRADFDEKEPQGRGQYRDRSARRFAE